LRSARYEGIDIEECETCEGRWLEAGELKKIIDAREVHFEQADRRTAGKKLRSPDVPQKERDRVIACPVCSGPTDNVNYGQDTGIIINRCPECAGIWLDRCELEMIQTLVEGLDDQRA